MKNDRFIAILSTGPRKTKLSVFSYIQSVPLTRRKGLCPILIIYFEDQVKNFLKHISFYFLNAWFDRYAKLKLTNFGQNAKISQLQVLTTP
jgi:hypothetical protein